MRNMDKYRWPEFESLFPEPGEDESFEDAAYGMDDLCNSPPEDDEPEPCTINRPASWLVDHGGLLLVGSKERRLMDAMMYQLVVSAEREHSARLFLSKQDRHQFLKSFVMYLTKLGCDDDAGDLRERYEQAKRKIAYMDLEIHELFACPIEDLRELTNVAGLYDSVMIFDSLMSLTSKATDKWMLSRGIIAVRLREYLEDYIGAQSIVVFEQTFPGIDYHETYASFDSYLDGSMLMLKGESRCIDGSSYWGVGFDLRSRHANKDDMFQVLNVRTNQFYDDWPKPDKTPLATDDLFDSTSDDMPF